MVHLRDPLFDPYLRERREDWWQAYDRLRRLEPVHWSPAAGAWTLSRYADALSVLRDPGCKPIDAQAIVREIARRTRRPLPNLVALFSAAALFNGTAGHVPLRRFLAAVLKGRALSALAPEVERSASELWREAVRAGGFDLVGDFADRLPPRVIGGVLGIPESDLPRFGAWTQGVVGLFDLGRPLRDYRETDAQVGEGLDYLRTLLEERRRRPCDDGLTRMPALARELGLAPEIVAPSAFFLYMVGVETTAAFIGSAFLALLRHPEELARLRAGAVPMERAVEELLRFESPAEKVARVAAAPVEIGGETIRAGQKLVLLIGAANRDPAAYAAPERLDLGRVGPPHLAFGEGGHACIGASLARLEGRIALDGFLALPKLRIMREPMSWWQLDTVRRLKRLEVALD